MNKALCLLLVAASLLLSGCAALRDRPASDARAVLAPTGTLRVGVNVGSPTQMVRIGPQAEPRGVSHDIGRALAARLNVPVEVVEFRTGNELLAATKAGRVDLMGTNATAVRAMDLDFTATVVEIELGYLVPAGSVLQGADEMKRPGLRVGITQNSTSQTTVPQRLPQAVVVLAPTLAAASRLIKEGGVDVYTTNKAILFELSDDLPGSRVLPGSVGVELWAMAVPKGRQAALPYLNAFLQEVRQSGELARAMERAGLRGARLPSP